MLESHKKKVQWWDDRRQGRSGSITNELADGISAYACRQADINRRLASRFATLWSGYTDVSMDERTAAEEEEEEEEEELDADEIVDESGLYI